MKNRCVMNKIFRLLVVLLLLVGVQISHARGGKIIRVLAIGNSFSEDAVEQNLHELAAADGQTLVIGNLYIGGCTLERHYNNAQSNAASYRYKKILADGTTVTVQNVSLDKALSDEQWDYVSMQQASGVSGIYSTYTLYLPGLIEYVRQRVPAKTKLLWHQTWAYAKDSNHGEYPNYGKDQMKMYNAIMDASRRAVKDYGFNKVIPSGTTVQNARTTVVGDKMNRDGYHLQLTYGRYAAACAWYETLCRKDVRKNTFVPAGVDKPTAKAMQMAAHAAVRSPYKVTNLSGEKYE